VASSAGTNWDGEELRALRASTRRFAEREVVPYLSQWEDDGALPRSLHAAAAKAGLLGLGFDEAVGGSGGGPVESFTVAEQLILSGGSSGLVASLMTCPTWCGPVITT